MSGMSSRRAPSVTSSAVKPCTWIDGATAFTARDVDVVVAVEVGMDAALQAHLGGAALDGLDDAPLHLFELEQVGRAAQVERQRPFEKAQKRHLNVQTFV